MNVTEAGAELRAAAEARPLKLPVRRRVDERYHRRTPDGLDVWFTIQVSPHARIYDAVFERDDRMPADGETSEWLKALVPERALSEAPAIPGSFTRRFEAFERMGDATQAPIA